LFLVYLRLHIILNILFEGLSVVYYMRIVDIVSGKVLIFFC
jgi:hypothetical protein